MSSIVLGIIYTAVNKRKLVFVLTELIVRRIRK